MWDTTEDDLGFTPNDEEIAATRQAATEFIDGKQRELIEAMQLARGLSFGGRFHEERNFATYDAEKDFSGRIAFTVDDHLHVSAAQLADENEGPQTTREGAPKVE